MSYIIRIEMSDGYRIVTRVSKSNVHFYQNPQLLDNEHNRWSWYKDNYKRVLSYKTAIGADKMVKRLSEQYPDLSFENLKQKMNLEYLSVVLIVIAEHLFNHLMLNTSKYFIVTMTV